MEKDNLLKRLFPSDIIRGAIKRAIKVPQQPAVFQKVEYKFLDKDKKQLADTFSVACFALIASHYKVAAKKGAPHFMRYKPGCTLSKEKQLAWIKLGQEIGVMPIEEEAESIQEEGLTINLYDESLSVSKVYVQLNFLRWMRENSGLVLAVLILTLEGGRDFWASVAFAHKTHCNYMGHSLIPFQGDYVAASANRQLSNSIGFVLRLHQLCNSSNANDERKLLDHLKRLRYNVPWEWHKRLTKFDHKYWFNVTDNYMLLFDELFPAFASEDFETAEAIINKLKRKKRTNVRFA